MINRACGIDPPVPALACALLVCLAWWLGGVPRSQAASFEGLGFLPGYTNWIAAFIWDSAHGMRNLQSVLAGSYGLDLTGWSLKKAAGISADGNTIVGYGTDPAGKTEAWLAVLAEPTPLVLTNSSLANGIFGFTILSAPGQPMTVEYATTLAGNSWSTLLTTNSPGGQVRIAEPATHSPQFYRARKGF